MDFFLQSYYYVIFFQEVIQYLKHTCPAHLYATSISPPAAQQIISAIKVILGQDGSNRGLRAFFLLKDLMFYFSLLSLKLMVIYS